MTPFRVVYENRSILVVEKPAGMVVHPTYRNLDGTLVDAVAAWMAARGEERPWLLHRLDKDTSGLVIFARSPHALRLCERQFAQHTVVKCYCAIVWGTDLPEEGEIALPLGRDPTDRRRVIVRADGQEATTRYTIVARRQTSTMLHVWPRTGRTHQIRAHLTALGSPIVGDPTYALEYPAAPRLMLHAMTLALRVPVDSGGTRLRTFLAPLPPEMLAWEG